MTTSRAASRGRSGAHAALLALAGFGTVLTRIDRADLSAAIAVGAALGLVLAHGSPAVAFREVRMALFVVLLTALLEATTGDAGDGLRLFLHFSALLCAGQIITTLWSWAELGDAMVTLLRPLDRIGLVDAERCAFTLMLAIRFVPVMFEEVAEIREAQALRGRDRSILALAVPLGLRILLRSEEIAAAVDLRTRPYAPSCPRDRSTSVARGTPLGGTADDHRRSGNRIS